ncbi:MAG: anti-sigma regulatory factor [Gomphosphaeria aponina SAG 52.96 = DSM 107014]|uniref:Anti-sigma regulatory factor n=1 Tax=Gomphosphaeria aponina SAG 52.96 = DSM 107014 TaxID=1521640 RepID=A0A941JSW0_9CHRO|nr:anti-sigma regulatory factor [Gomphosphaeria aponina SAG 52.96 = DSM 107014]
MISISLPLKPSNWNTMSFASTLYLYPVLDLCCAKIPTELQAEIRLGLQEALVNAAIHGNNLDPSKRIVIQFFVSKEELSWVITDQGEGFITNCECPEHGKELPPEEAESGRGFCILHEIFDQVHWNRQGTQLRLCKQVKKGKKREPVLC